MSCQTKARKAAVALMAGACAAFIGAGYLARAHQQRSAPTQPVGRTLAEVAPDTRIVLHGIHLREHSGRLDRGSEAALDYVVRILERNPRAVVCVGGHADETRGQDSGRDVKLMNRQAQAAATYLERRGVSAQRLFLLNSCNRLPGPNQELAQAGSRRRTIEVVELDFASPSNEAS